MAQRELDAFWAGQRAGSAMGVAATDSETEEGEEKFLTVRLEQPGSGDELALSPFDRGNMSRSIPMAWFFRQTLDSDALLAALKKTLEAYPVLCGRYAAPAPPAAVVLSNKGVPVHVCSSPTPLSAAVAHLGRDQHSLFSRETHAPFVPTKSDMDPDKGDPAAPLMKIRLTQFS